MFLGESVMEFTKTELQAELFPSFKMGMGIFVIKNRDKIKLLQY